MEDAFYAGAVPGFFAVVERKKVWHGVASCALQFSVKYISLPRSTAAA